MKIHSSGSKVTKTEWKEERQEEERLLLILLVYYCFFMIYVLYVDELLWFWMIKYSIGRWLRIQQWKKWKVKIIKNSSIGGIQRVNKYGWRNE